MILLITDIEDMPCVLTVPVKGEIKSLRERVSCIMMYLLSKSTTRNEYLPISNNSTNFKARKNHKKWGFMIIAALLALLSYLVCKITNGLYADVDNFYVAEVTAGVFDDNNNCYYINPLMCLLIKGLSNLIPGTDWFTSLSHINLLFAVAIIVFQTITETKWSAIEKVAVTLWIIYWVVGLGLYSSNYTVWSAFFCFTAGICLFGKSQFITVCGHNRLAAFFIILCICWRIEIFWLSIPFFSLRYIGVLVSSHQEMPVGKEWKCSASLMMIIMCVLVVSCHYGVRLLPQNREAVKYNRARTVITDYPMKSWDDFSRKDIINEEDYLAITKEWCFLDTESFNADILMEIANAGKRILTLSEALRLLSDLFYHNWQLLLVPFWGLVLLCVRNLLCGDREARLETIVSFLGSLLIVWFFAIKGRLPLRVFLSLILLCSLPVLTSKKIESKLMLQKCIFVIFIVVNVLITGAVLLNAGQKTPQWAFQSRRDLSYNDLYQETVQGDKLFFWPVSSFAKEYYMDMGVLMDRDFVSHNLADGAWTYGQPYMNNLLHVLNADIPLKALVDREETYYVAEDPQFILQLLRNHYGEDVQAYKAGTLVGNVSYWNFSMD